MRKNIMKKIFCVMMSTTIIGQTALTNGAYAAWDKERAVEIGKKSLPYVLGVGISAAAAAIIIPMVVKSNQKSPTQATGTGSDSESKTDVVITKPVIDKCMSEGRLPGIKVYYEKKGKDIVEYGYVVEDEKLASQFLSVYCRLNPVDIKNIFRKDHVNVFLKYSDNQKENFVVEYGLLWSYMKEAVATLVDLDAYKSIHRTSTVISSSVSGSGSHLGKDDSFSDQGSSSDAPKMPNEDILERIDVVEAATRSGDKHSTLYDDLRKYGNGDLVGSDDGFKQGIDAEVNEGVIPGLALLRFRSTADLWFGKAEMSTWYSYKIIDEDLFRGYLRVRLNCDVQQAQQALNLFREQEQKLFLYDEGNRLVVSVWNWIKQKGINVGHHVAGFFRNMFGYGKSDAIVNPEGRAFARKEFLSAGIFENFNKDVVAIKSMPDTDVKKFNGMIDFSEFTAQPVTPEKMRKYTEFLRNCGCL